MYDCFMKVQLNILTMTSIISFPASAAYKACWENAANRYNIPVVVLKAIAHVESGNNPTAIRKNKNGSYDYGLMQINTRWLRYLKGYGITEESIKKPCTNIMVGAWILKQEIIRFGFNWQAVGAYHAGAFTQRTRDKKVVRYKEYSAKVYRYIESQRSQVQK